MSESVHKRKTPWLSTVRAVLWGFLGVRKHSAYQEDVAKLNPLHLMMAGIALVFVFVGLLIGLVNWVVS